jgi:hypothetical protein
MRDIKFVYIHCSYSVFGTFDVVDSWHKDRGFASWHNAILGRDCNLGYHYLVLNAFDTKKSFDQRDAISSITDGQIVSGRPIDMVGAHVAGANSDSIGICYVGVLPSPLQLESLYSLCINLVSIYSLDVSNVLGHYEYYLNAKLPMEKTCPNFCMQSFRSGLSYRIGKTMV